MLPRESRANVIALQVRMALAHSGLTMRGYAIDVAKHYNDHVPLQARDLTFHCSADIHADVRANSQILQRMLDGTTVRLPVSLEESLVLCLPQPYRDELQRELAARLGLLAAPLPRMDGARDTVSIGELMQETGELLQALAPAMADGKIDASDAPHARRALRELRDVMSRCMTLESNLLTCMTDAAPHRNHNVAPLARKAG